MRMRGDIEHEGLRVGPCRALDRLAEVLDETAGIVAIADRMGEIVDVHRQRQIDDAAPVVEFHDRRQIVVVTVAMPDIAGLGEQRGRDQAARAARRNPANRRHAAGRLDDIVVARDVGPLASLVEIQADDIHAPGMADNFMPAREHFAKRAGIVARQNARRHHTGLDAIGVGDPQQALNTPHGAITRPGMGVGVEIAGLQQIAHGADARRLAIRPRLVGEVEHQSDALAAGPAKIRRGAPDLVRRRGNGFGDHEEFLGMMCKMRGMLAASMPWAWRCRQSSRVSSGGVRRRKSRCGRGRCTGCPTREYRRRATCAGK